MTTVFGRLVLLAVALLILEAGDVHTAPSTSQCDVSLRLPEGFCGTVYVEALGPARHLTVSAGGTVYVILYRRYPSDSGAGGIVALQDTDHDGRADKESRFGIYGTELRWRDQYLYASNAQEVVRYLIPDGAVEPVGRPETVVSGFPGDDSSEHWPKPFTFDGDGHLYVAVSAPSNSCQEENRRPRSPGLLPCPFLLNSGGIWKLKEGRLGQHYSRDGVRVATGMRATLSLAWNFQSQSIHFVQNGRDDLHAIWPERFTEAQNARLPAEELLTASRDENFGWPYCYFDPDRGTHVAAPEYGGDGSLVGGCWSIPKPRLAFPSHWVPGDLLFYDRSQFPAPFNGGAFVAFLGGWGRRPLPQDGYRVVFVPYKDGAPAGGWVPFADGFAGERPPKMPIDAIHRPSGLAIAADGSLMIVDSRKGRIWIVRYIGH